MIDHLVARKANLNQMFRECDQDGSGDIDVDELQAALQQMGLRMSRQQVELREKGTGGAGGSLEPPGLRLTHLHTIHMAYAECLPTCLDPLAERTCFSQVELIMNELDSDGAQHPALLAATMAPLKIGPTSSACPRRVGVHAGCVLAAERSSCASSHRVPPARCACFEFSPAG